MYTTLFTITSKELSNHYMMQILTVLNYDIFVLWLKARLGPMLTFEVSNFVKRDFNFLPVFIFTMKIDWIAK